MASEKGLAEAFSFYVADSGILNAGDSNFIGKQEVRKRFERTKYRNVRLRWTPEFIDISESCDLAYTWGKYTYTYRDSSGKEVVDKGIFHTVWKKQADGSWRFVWD
jgi:ketosteroid isomerase-like protein